MNTAVYLIADGVSCSGCGGVLAGRHENEFSLCESCFYSVELFCGTRVNRHRTRHPRKRITELDVSQWLANRLKREAAAFSKTGVVGRCEAISGWAYGTPGTQCARSASFRRDGHVVCATHAKASVPQYVGTETANPYTRFAAVLENLCGKDPLFAKMILDVANSLPVSQ